MLAQSPYLEEKAISKLCPPFLLQSHVKNRRKTVAVGSRCYPPVAAAALSSRSAHQSSLPSMSTRAPLSPSLEGSRAVSTMSFKRVKSLCRAAISRDNVCLNNQLSVSLLVITRQHVYQNATVTIPREQPGSQHYVIRTGQIPLQGSYQKKIRTALTAKKRFFFFWHPPEF